MFHHHAIEAFEPKHAYRSTPAYWYVDDDEYQRAVRRGMRLRSEIALRTVKAAGQAIAGVFRAGAEATGSLEDASGLRRHAGGGIDIEYYEALARRARAEAAADLFDAARAWFGGLGRTRRPRTRALHDARSADDTEL